MRRTAALLTSLAILGACGGPEEPPNPESPPGVEEPGYEPGMTTGETGEVIDAEGRLEDRGAPGGEPPNAAPIADTASAR